LIRKSSPEGVLDVLDGTADAVIVVGGKPLKLFRNMESLQRGNSWPALLEGVHFLPLKDPRMLEEYQAGEITRKDYDFVQEPVPTMAATAVLVDYDFAKSGRRHAERCREIRHLATAIRKNLPWLQAHGHPKWKEVRLDENVAVWKKDSCS